MPLHGGVDRVVILEDSDDDFETVCEVIRRLNLRTEVCRVTDGDECVAFLARTMAHLPSLVLLDLNAPGSDGREALRQIKLDDVLKRIPVVILTTSTNPRDLDLCYLIGANAYHTKPVRYPEHMRLIEAILGYWLDDVARPPHLVHTT